MHISRNCRTRRRKNAVSGTRKSKHDGYLLREEHIYNPKTIVSVMLRENFKSYRVMTGTYESIIPLIEMDFDGLKEDNRKFHRTLVSGIFITGISCV